MSSFSSFTYIVHLISILLFARLLYSFCLESYSVLPNLCGFARSGSKTCSYLFSPWRLVDCFCFPIIYKRDRFVFRFGPSLVFNLTISSQVFKRTCGIKFTILDRYSMIEPLKEEKIHDYFTITKSTL